MRARVTLQSPVRGADDIGGAAIGWADEGDVWAEIMAGSAGQRADYDAAPSLSPCVARIYTRSDVRAGWRLTWGARTLRVMGVRNAGGPRIDLDCEEETF